jgi:hypothetical protein
MALPDTILVEEINSITYVEVSPVEEINQISVNTVSEVETINIDLTESVTNISIDNNAEDLIVQVSQVDPTSMVQSVNGRTGHVVIDYSQIAASPEWAAANGSSNAAPVNQVKYVHAQTEISNQWNIIHNLNFFPNVTIMDHSNRILEADIQYLNINSVRIIMNAPMSGTAYLT